LTRYLGRRIAAIVGGVILGAVVGAIIGLVQIGFAGPWLGIGEIRASRRFSVPS
jgi:hypothetical protein